MNRNQQKNLVTANKMLWILVCQIAVIFPHTMRIPIWLSLFCFAMGAWGYFSVTNRCKRPPRLILIMLVIFSCSAIGYSYKTLIGQDAGVSLLMTMMSLKILEIKKHQDVILFVFLGYFLVVTNFLFTQSIGMAIYMFVVCIGLTSTLIMLSRHDSQLNLKENIKLATTIIFQAMPVMLILFVLFPRLPSPLWAMPKDQTHAISGLSENMSPGSISQLSKSDAVAFRVSFEDNPPANSTLYWRGPVLSHFNGKTWTMGSFYTRKSLVDINPLNDPINYTVTIEPHNQKWLFALDIASLIPNQSYMNHAYSLINNQTIKETKHYKISSHTNYIIDQTLLNNDTEKYLQVPPNFNPKTKIWAQQLRAKHSDNAAIIKDVLKHIREQPFQYTLSPPLLGRNSVDDFFFQSRSGFCEHYAGSFTYLMRQLGIPARVVLGYQGGEYNKLGDYLIVRQSDAHAWSEVWLENRGWVRIDPTFSVAPERVERGIDAALPQRVSDGGLLRTNNRLLHSLIFYWDNVNYKWHRWVLGYNAQKQSSLLKKLGINITNWEDIAISIMVTVGGFFILLGIWLNLKKRKPKVDAAFHTYQKFCSQLKRIGFERRNHEGPVDFAQRVISDRQDLKTDIELITRFYVQLRYGSNPPKNLLSQFRNRVAKFRASKIIISNTP